MQVLIQRDCLGGDRLIEVQLPRAVALLDLDRVEGCTQRTVLSSLPRPFFRLDVPGSFSLSGIIGERRLRFTVRLAVRERATELALATCEHMMSRAG